MVLEMNAVVMGLDYRGVLPVERASGARIECVRGRIWVTEEDALEDVVLEAGESYDIRGDGLVILQALHPAVVNMRGRAAPAAEPLAARLVRVLARCAAIRPAASV